MAASISAAAAAAGVTHSFLPISLKLPISANFPNSPKFPSSKTLTFSSFPLHNSNSNSSSKCRVRASSDNLLLLEKAIHLLQSSPPSWHSAAFSNALIFVLGSPVLASGLSLPGIAAAFFLGTLSWRAFGYSGFLLVATYFIIGTAATKVKIAQKEAQGIAEKRKGRRGPGSVIGSSAAACVCALLSIYGIGGDAITRIWRLGFIASFCTKLSDTVSSEIGKAYGKTTYLVTTFKIVPRGAEGAVSIEGTVAGLAASILLASFGYLLGQIEVPEAIVCVIASQIANLGESLIGASLQGKEGLEWLNNDVVNVINISLGSILAVLMNQLFLGNWGT